MDLQISPSDQIPEGHADEVAVSCLATTTRKTFDLFDGKNKKCKILVICTFN